MIARLPPLGAILCSLSLILQPSLSATTYSSTNTATDQQDNTVGNCTCFVVKSGADSNSLTYFQYYSFYDFRNLYDNPKQYIKAPPLLKNSQDAGEETVWDAKILNSTSWNTDWGIQNWSKSSTEDFPTRMVNSPANVYLQQNDDSNDPFTFLTLRTSRLDDFQSAAEIENEQKNIMHVSMRMYARVTGSKGAVAGFFTFYDDSNESDIEILTDDATDVIRYTNQPSVDKDGNEVSDASKAPNKLAPWDQWQTHRIDWLDKNSYWFLNDKQVAANTYSVPRKPSGLVINMWSDGGEWSGNMTVGDSAEFQIQWIEMAFNTSGPIEGPAGGTNKRSVEAPEKRKDKGCEVVCKIDGVETVGSPEIYSKGTAGPSISRGLLVVVGIISLFVAW